MGASDEKTKKQAGALEPRTLRGGIDVATLKKPEPKMPVLDTLNQGADMVTGFFDSIFKGPPAPALPPAPGPAPDTTDAMLRERALSELMRNRTRRGLASTFVTGQSASSTLKGGGK